MFIEATVLEHSSLLGGVRDLWVCRRFCDVTLQSRDGASLEAHRLVLAAASEAFSALVGGQFAEGRGGPIQLDVSQQALSATIGYLYGQQVDLPPEVAPCVLKFAHMYGLNDLQEKIVKGLPEHLDDQVAIRMLPECELLELGELDTVCEQYIAEHFDTCALVPGFTSLSAPQLGRILKHEKLTVACEEAVLQAVLAWHTAAPGRDLVTSLLLQQVNFPSMAMTSLQAVERYAQSAGPCGRDMQKEATRAIAVHRNGSVVDGEPPAKRRCFGYWWPEFGASMVGGVVVAGGQGVGEGLHELNAPRNIVLQGDAVLIADRMNKRVVRWQQGSSVGQLVAGQGAPMNGVNDFSVWCAIGLSSHGEILVSDRDNDRVIRFTESGGSVVGQGLWTLLKPRAVCSTRAGAIYVLDNDGRRVQKLEDAVSSTVVSGLQSPACMAGLFVTDSGVVYICETDHHRVRRWVPGADVGTIVAGGNGEGSARNQLYCPEGIFVTPDDSVYVCDRGNHRVVKWPAGASAGLTVAGGHGNGRGSHQLSSPLGVHIATDGAMYVLDGANARVTKWAPRLTLALSALSTVS